MGIVQNITGVYHSRCCAIAEILWSRSRLPEVHVLKKIKNSVTATLSQLTVHLTFNQYTCSS